MNDDTTVTTPINELEMGENTFEIQEDLDIEDSAGPEQAREAPAEDLPEVDLSNFCQSQSTSIAQAAGEAGVISIINSPKSGKRLIISSDLMERLNQPAKVKVAFHEGTLAMSEQLPTNGHAFVVKKSKRKGNVYAAALIDEITKEFGLDFNNRVSITFHECHYGQFNGFPVAIIKISG